MQASQSTLDLNNAPYVLYGVNYIDLVSLARVSGQFMLRQGKWKLIAYATAASPKAFPPQLFDISTDVWEMHNVADQNPAVVASMDAVLRTQIDYPAVMKEYEAQGHDWAGRWTAAFPNQGWKSLLHAAYRNFSADDEAKFERWLDGAVSGADRDE